MKSKKIIIATVSTIVAIAILWFCFGGESKSANYIIETAQAVRGDVSEAVTATGTIEPVTQVEVGTQVSGIIDKLYVWGVIRSGFLRVGENEAKSVCL